MPEKQYTIMLDFDTRKRHYHLIEDGKIIRFSVQLEVKTPTSWKVVIRYDTYHGYAHKDCFTINGRGRKINLYIEFQEALTMADEDINENWELYRERFFKGVFP